MVYWLVLFLMLPIFYNPLRQMAALWANFQVAMAGWDRISDILSLNSNLEVVPENISVKDKCPILEFRSVSFGYAPDKEILHDINFSLDKGKTYALVGANWRW